MKEKWFTFHWNNGSSSYHIGNSPADAAKKAGFGASVMKVLDWTEETRTLPLQHKDVILIQNGRYKPAPKDAVFHQELIKQLEMAENVNKYRELNLSVMGSLFTIKVELRRFEIICVVTSIERCGETFPCTIEADTFGFMYDYDINLWKVVDASSSNVSSSAETFSSWWEAQVHCAKLNDVDKYTTCICIDCQAAYPISVNQQEWFSSRGLSSPKRCIRCRDRKKEEKYMDGIIAIVANDKIAQPSEIDRMESAVNQYLDTYGGKWRYIHKAQKLLREWKQVPG